MARKTFSESDAQSIKHIRALAAADDSQNSPTLPNVEPKGLPTLPEPLDRELTPMQCMAITHLMAGKTVSSVATLLNIDRKTLYNWRQLPAFKATLRSLCQEACEAAAMRMRNILLRGTHRLAEFVDYGDFNRVFKVVANKRVWDMASVMPAEEEPEPSEKPAEQKATKETEPASEQAPVEGSTQASESDDGDASRPERGDAKEVSSPAKGDAVTAMDREKHSPVRSLHKATVSKGEPSGQSHGLPNPSADEMRDELHRTHALRR